MSRQPHPEPGVSYSAIVNEEFATARGLEAAASLGMFLGVDPL